MFVSFHPRHAGRRRRRSASVAGSQSSASQCTALNSGKLEQSAIWSGNIVGSSGVAGNSTRYRSDCAPGTEAAIALQVECEPLKQAHHIAQPITAPFQHFELVVQPFHKAAALALDEVVDNQL